MLVYLSCIFSEVSVMPSALMVCTTNYNILISGTHNEGKGHHRTSEKMQLR